MKSQEFLKDDQNLDTVRGAIVNALSVESAYNSLTKEVRLQ